MEKFLTFYESTKINKFNINWQLVRTKARAIHDVPQKIEYVMNFLREYPNQYNFARVWNWIKMTGVAYPKTSAEHQAFIEAEQKIHENEGQYASKTDDINDLTKVSTADLKLVLDDLKKRKYAFQFGKVPEDHIHFVQQLEDELKKR